MTKLGCVPLTDHKRLLVSHHGMRMTKSELAEVKSLPAQAGTNPKTTEDYLKLILDEEKAQHNKPVTSQDQDAERGSEDFYDTPYI